jgi:hypothetical protein
MERAEQTTTEQARERGADDPLRRLEARLERASSAAERLFSEAASEAASAAVSAASRAQEAAGGPPPQGWQLPRTDIPRPGREDFEAILGAWYAVRDLLPPELRHRLAEALRELLLAVRALIDWYLERAEPQRDGPVEVQDIPIL